MNRDLSPVAILAGGLATRLRPLTETIPKALIEIQGEPFIAHQLRLLAARGICRVVLCTGYLGHMIEEFVGDGSRFGVKVSYSPDGPRLLGTAGCLKQAAPLLGGAFFVLYGDSYLPCNYGAVQEAFERAGKSAMMTVYRNEGRFDTSNIEFADGRILAYDKWNRTTRMHHIDYGLGMMRREALDVVAAGEVFDLADLYQIMLARGELAACEVPERFYETGSLAGIEDLNAFLQGGKGMEFIRQYLVECRRVIDQIDAAAIEKMIGLLAAAREMNGRLFILGVGGSAANASHAVNDFRKIVGMEAYAPTDNVSELTARTNDEGWASVFVEWLKGSRLRADDVVLVLSVGGGNLQKNVSPNLVTALQYARRVGAGILGIVGRDGGYTAQVADACVVVPTVNPQNVTPHTEAFQGVIWHLLVSHPTLKTAQTKWESV